MRIKHFMGYGTVEATRIKDPGCTLHIRVTGNHECGVYRKDVYDLYNWLVRKFDRKIPDVTAWMKMWPEVCIEEGTCFDDAGNSVEYCEYYFTYDHK